MIVNSGSVVFIILFLISRLQKPKPEKELRFPVIPTHRSDITKGSNYQWEQPLPPPPLKGPSKVHLAAMRKQHEKYCKYYDLTRKKLQLYTSVCIF